MVNEACLSESDLSSITQYDNEGTYTAQYKDPSFSPQSFPNSEFIKLKF